MNSEIKDFKDELIEEAMNGSIEKVKNPLIKDFKKQDVMDELKKKGWTRKQRRLWYKVHKKDEVELKKPEMNVMKNGGMK